MLTSSVEAAAVPLGDVGGTRSGASASVRSTATLGRLAGQRLGERPQPLLAAGDEDQLGAGLAGEPPRGRLADPARGAGHNDVCAVSPISTKLFESSVAASPVDSTYCAIFHGRDPELLDKLLRAGAPSGLRGARGRGLAGGRVLRLALQRRPRLLDRQGRRGGAAARRRRPHRRDRPRRHPHRREGLPLLRPDRRLGPADPGRPAGRGARQGRPRAGRRRPQADPPARARAAQKGRRAEGPAHRRRRRRPRRGGASWSGSATRP